MSNCSFTIRWWIYLVQKLVAAEFAAELAFVKCCRGVGWGQEREQSKGRETHFVF
jgi:hypothetical protein